MKEIKEGSLRVRKICFMLTMISALLFSAVSFADQYKLEESGGGYCYTIQNVCLPDFTQDENYRLPKNKEVAEERFKRRKEFVEKWYQENSPQYLKKTNYFIEVPKAIISVPLFPLFGFLEWIDEKKRSSPDEIEKQKRNNEIYLRSRDQMHEFIVKDCEQERIRNEAKGE